MSNLIGKNILIVDEVDDTRTTLEYAVKELVKDVEAARKQSGKEAQPTRFSIFVVHVGPKEQSDGFHQTDVSAEQRQTQKRSLAGRHDRGEKIPCRRDGG